MHYNRMLRHGTPTPAGHRVVGNDEARYLSRIDKTETCWIWRTPTKPHEYPVMRIAKRAVCVHRWAYEHFVGPIPEGYQVDHLCRNIRCVNPAHLEPVTQIENLRRQREALGIRRGKCTLCDKPHRCKGLCGTHYQRWRLAGRPEDQSLIA
jgi:hypothetical protein